MVGFVLASLVAACQTPAAPAELSIVVSTSILGDVVREVAGQEASVTVLIPVGASPHDYSPSARQVAEVADADLVVVNGLGLEEALVDVMASAAQNEVLTLGPELTPLPAGPSGQFDPHVWMDPVRVADGVDLIVERLVKLDPAGDWNARGEAYRARLETLHSTIERWTASIPSDRRFLVTNHDSLEYFADRYGLDVIGTVIPGTSTLAEPSAADLADLAAIIEETGTSAIFAETTEPDRLAAAVASEFDRPITIVTLYTGSLGEPGSPADTYLGMMLEDAQLITSALGGTTS